MEPDGVIYQETCFVEMRESGTVRIWRLAPIEGGPVEFFGRGLHHMVVDRQLVQVPFEFKIPGDTPKQAFEACDEAAKEGAKKADADAKAEIAAQRRRIVVGGELPPPGMRIH
jgi:hypothetical protein